jgi:hypothetical protein
MRVERKFDKRKFNFEDIRQATIFTKHGETFIKGSSNSAVNIETGQILYPANDADGGWDECFIYPRASLRLT